MKKLDSSLLMLAGLLLLLPLCELSGQRAGKAGKIAGMRLSGWEAPQSGWLFPEGLRIDSLTVDESQRQINIYLPVAASYNPVREESYHQLLGSVRAALKRKLTDYDILFHTNGYRLEALIPNYFRYSSPVDQDRVPPLRSPSPELVRRVGAVTPGQGLAGRYIALWHSHGYYYEISLDRWEWQRAKLFGSVEDLSVMAYVVPYLLPMLENSGATVFLPRERDIQRHEVIVDNDRSGGASLFSLLTDTAPDTIGRGFLLRDTLFTGDNPFAMGTSLKISGGPALFVPDLPEEGRYGVSLSYPQLSGHRGTVTVTVRHSGGSTDYIVDQSLGGGTWIWLGSFLFGEGRDSDRGSVTITPSEGGEALIDAVRFGGGMGSVARRPSGSVTANQWSLNAGSVEGAEEAGVTTTGHSWKLSGKPRFLEGARYWLQYAGMPDTLVYTPNRGKNDYNDDYMSRAEWVNYLLGEPDGEGGGGLGIPVDLSLAFHTDAGITPDNSVIGTLGIYSTLSGQGRFPDGTSRLASRDLTDIIQTQITEDVRVLFNPDWTRRAMWDRSYYEARRPDVPAMLLELLSHQNLADQRHGFDPRFRFHVSRAIYKGMLRYLAEAGGVDYVVHPLPVSHFAIEPAGGKRVRLSWQPVADPLEPTATPASYMLYRRIGDAGYDNGTPVADNSLTLELPQYNTLYSFKVTALNEGGESFPSEELSVGIVEGTDERVLIVNGFDRVSGPAWFDRDGMAGVAWWDDRGVADHYNFVTTGDQYDYERSSPWRDDDDAGWGACYSDDEGRVIPGNTFDFTRIHGESVMAAGRSFFSVSDEVFTGEGFDLSGWSALNLLYGEEKSTPSLPDPDRYDYAIYTPEFIRTLGRVEKASLPLFMSGAYIGTDLAMASDSYADSLVQRVLHFTHRTGHAVRTGRLGATDQAAPHFAGEITFNSGTTDELYAAEAPDALEPADRESFTAFRYLENNTSAAVMHTGRVRTFVMGFPFETIISQQERDSLMKQILDFLQNK